MILGFGQHHRDVTQVFCKKLAGKIQESDNQDDISKIALKIRLLAKQIIRLRKYPLSPERPGENIWLLLNADFVMR
jgi:hypothetical protein